MTANLPANTLLSFINDLPSLGPVLGKLSAIAANPASSAEDMTKVLKLDPVLTAKVLRLANSAYVGISRTISSLKNAIVLLGQKRICSLAMTATMLSTMKPAGSLPFLHRDYWKHSIIAGLVAESIARYVRRFAPVDSDEAFTAGILHDMGKLVLGCYAAGHITSAARQSLENNVPFNQAEQQESSHQTAGGLLAQRWNFPPDIAEAMMLHHAPERSVEHQRMVSIVHLSDVMAHMMGFPTIPGEIPPMLDPKAMGMVNISPELLRAIANEALQNEKTMELFIDFIE